MSTPVAPRGLRRFLAPARPPVERCELCGVELPEEHRHLVDVEQRALACACPPCTLLLDRDGANRGRFRAVPRRLLTDPQAELGPPLWNALSIPVGVAFLLHNSALDRPVAIYPSPGGATESDPGTDAWQALAAATPLAELVCPDVEALLLWRDDRTDLCALVPIDLAYALVGRLRQHWQGFDGGAEVRAELAAFRADLEQRATPVDRSVR